MASSKTLLIIDDEEPIRKLTKRILKRLTIETLDASTGKEGLEQLKQHQEDIDGILLDLHLPDGTGAEWAGKYREICTDLPIIFFSGASRPSCCSDDTKGLNHFIKKPFTPQAMQGVVKDVFS